MIFSLQQFLFLIITYLICSIPFGLLISKFFIKKDIRNYGSGNIGATNVTRVAGKMPGLLTLILDGAKGAVMIIFARFIFNDVNNYNSFLAVVGAVAVIGHVFPVYIKFKGGKGVATTIAVLLAINPIVGLINAAVWLVIFIITRISALASLVSIITATAFVSYYHTAKAEIILCFFLTVLILMRHKDNIYRLLSGKENKF